MKEFFLNHICTTPQYTVASREYQHRWLVRISAVVLPGVAASVIALWAHSRAGKSA